MSPIKPLVTSALLAFSLASQAHTGLKTSAPTDGAALEQSPQQLVLNYSGPVRAVKVVLSSAAGERVDFGFAPSAKANKNFSWQLPQLPAASYQVQWIVVGGDGHKMKGDFDFSVSE